MNATLAGFTVAAGFALAACNPVQRIAASTNEIRTEAQALVKHGEATGDSVVVDRASKIDGLAAGIHEDLPNVQAKPSDIMDLLKYAAIGLSLVSVAVILWQTGIGTAIRVAVGWIPRKKREEAAFIEAVLDPERPENTREYIAARRAADPELNAAIAAKESK
jgi:hypothetical protein